MRPSGDRSFRLGDEFRLDLHPRLIVRPYQVVMAMNEEEVPTTLSRAAGVPSVLPPHSEGGFFAGNRVSGGLFDAEVDGVWVEGHGKGGGDPPPAFLHDLQKEEKVH